MPKILLKLLYPAAILFLGILVFIFLKSSKPEAQEVAIKQRVWPVKTLIAQPQALTPSITLYGKIETPELVNAAAPGNGRVLSISVQEGDAIHKNQRLLSLDPRDYLPKVKRAEARVNELKALLNNETIRYQADKKAYQHEKFLLGLEKTAVQRAQQLKNKNLGSTAALEQAQEELARQQLSLTSRKMSLDEHPSRKQQLEAQLAYQQAELDLALLALERSEIIAPFDGYIQEKLVAVGEQIKENQVLLSYYPIDKLEVRAKIPTSFIDELYTAFEQGTALMATASGQIQLQLDRLAGAADTRGIDALFRVISGGQLLKPGASVSLALQRPTRQNSIAIPFSALYDNNRIYLMRDGRLSGVQVQRLGERRHKEHTQLLISSPQISAGDRIVVTQLPNAVNGLAVSEAQNNP